MVTGIIATIGQIMGFVDMATGVRPVELLITNVPYIVFAPALIYAAFVGWRKW